MTAATPLRRPKRKPRPSSSVQRCHDAFTRLDCLRKANARVPLTQRECALLLGVSRGLVFKLEQSALEKLRAAALPAPWEARA